MLEKRPHLDGSAIRISLITALIVVLYSSGVCLSGYNTVGLLVEKMDYGSELPYDGASFFLAVVLPKTGG